jgi:hypothetical protein
MAAAAPKPLTDDEKAASAVARRWIAELDQSEKWQADYLRRAKRIVQRFKNDVFYADATLAPEQRRFAILWSNIKTLGPAVYARTPSPVVSRRFKDADPVGRMASEVLERAISFSLDQYDFDDRMNLSRDDYLLVGRGQVWARYVPHVATPIPGQPIQPNGPQEDAAMVSDSSTGEAADDTITYQEALCDHVAYVDWGMAPCRSWDETGYVWRRVYMARDELVKRFGKKIGKAIPLDWSPRTIPTTPTTTTSGRSRRRPRSTRSGTRRRARWSGSTDPIPSLPWINGPTRSA